MREVDCRAAHQRMTDEDVLYIDVRTPEEFAAGHPAGALNVPIAFGYGDNPDFVRVIAALVDPAEPVLIGCRTGELSVEAALKLEAEGFTDCLHVVGGFAGVPRGPYGPGIAGWAQLGLPVSTDVDHSGYTAVLERVLSE